jgi:hypothetical protein
MDLLLLAPDIREMILSLPAVEAGDDPIHERQLRAIVAVLDWRTQREDVAGRPAAVRFLSDDYRLLKSLQAVGAFQPGDEGPVHPALEPASGR